MSYFDSYHTKTLNMKYDFKYFLVGWWSRWSVFILLSASLGDTGSNLRPYHSNWIIVLLQSLIVVSVFFNFVTYHKNWIFRMLVEGAVYWLKFSQLCSPILPILIVWRRFQRWIGFKIHWADGLRLLSYNNNNNSLQYLLITYIIPSFFFLYLHWQFFSSLNST